MKTKQKLLSRLLDIPKCPLGPNDPLYCLSLIPLKKCPQLIHKLRLLLPSLIEKKFF